MSFGSVLLRVLLCLCLVVQGMGVALADVPAADRAPMRMTARSNDAAPCGGHAMAHHRIGSAAMARGAAPDASIPDCCKSRHCACAGAHFAMASVSLLDMPSIPTGQQRPIATSTEGHPEPALPHLIRPPIG